MDGGASGDNTVGTRCNGVRSFTMLNRAMGKRGLSQTKQDDINTEKDFGGQQELSMKVVWHRHLRER